MASIFRIGTATTDITPSLRNIGMMGYGRPWNKALSLETPLLARAMVVYPPNEGSPLVFVNAEIAFITWSIRDLVIQSLKTQAPHLAKHPELLCLTAQHTHSGIGGYSHFPFYNFTIPGFSREVLETYSFGMVKAIVEADQKKQPSYIQIASDRYSPNPALAINRSIDAYNRNPEVNPVTKDQAHWAVDLDFLMWKITNLEGKPTASVHWFGVHTTSIHNDNTCISPDNKGYASRMLEEQMASESPGFTAIFAQMAAGDISPNHRWNPSKKWTVGVSDQDFESARYNAALQMQPALALLKNPNAWTSLEAPIDAVLGTFDLGNTTTLPQFTHGGIEGFTSPPCHGVAFFLGTKEGPGMPSWLGMVATWLSRKQRMKDLKSLQDNPQHPTIKKYQAQGVKDILADTGQGILLGYHRPSKIPLPGFLDDGLRWMKRHDKANSLEGYPWVPQVLPLQLIRIGSLAIACLPAEITTIAARRLRQSILESLSSEGIQTVCISSYSNAYCGYITTYEEYQAQCYEGGHTVYGQHTLAAFQTHFHTLSSSLKQPSSHRTIPNQSIPIAFPDTILSKRSFPGL